MPRRYGPRTPRIAMSAQLKGDVGAAVRVLADVPRPGEGAGGDGRCKALVRSGVRARKGIRVTAWGRLPVA